MVDVSGELAGADAMLLEELAPTLEAHAQAVLEEHACGAAELSVHLCDDATIRRLNAQFRDQDEATDVLSFPQEADQNAATIAERPGAMLGDVLISVPTARRQAAALGHSVPLELTCLLVHGVLHLLGHDHEAPEEASAMRAEERRALGALGLPGEGLVGRVMPDP